MRARGKSTKEKESERGRARDERTERHRQGETNRARNIGRELGTEQMSKGGPGEGEGERDRQTDGEWKTEKMS